MNWSGPAPAEPGSEREPNLKVGFHRVKISRISETKAGDFVVVLANEHGEVAEFIPADIRPRSSEERAAAKSRGERDHGEWKFWRLTGGFDFPSADYWSTPLSERPPRQWNALSDLQEILDRQSLTWIEVSKWYHKVKQEWRYQVANVRSLTRHDMGDDDPGEAKSIVKEGAEDPHPSQFGGEVPF